jgi:hypothetical protein
MKAQIDLLRKTVATWQEQVDYEKRILGYADSAHVAVLEMNKNRLAKLEGAMKVVKPRRANTYCFTVNNTEGGKGEIENFRKECKIFNAEERIKALKEPGYVPKVKKIAVYGRLGKDNPNAAEYRAANKGWRNAYARIRIEDAATLDVYCGTYVKETLTYGGAPFTHYRCIGA